MDGCHSERGPRHHGRPVFHEVGGVVLVQPHDLHHGDPDSAALAAEQDYVIVADEAYRFRWQRPQCFREVVAGIPEWAPVQVIRPPVRKPPEYEGDGGLDPARYRQARDEIVRAGPGEDQGGQAPRAASVARAGGAPRAFPFSISSARRSARVREAGVRRRAPEARCAWARSANGSSGLTSARHTSTSHPGHPCTSPGETSAHHWPCVRYQGPVAE